MGVKRPWNIVDMPVYSLATYDDKKVNMNICTYVTAVSMKPKLFMVAVYYGTKTFEILSKTNLCTLQILSSTHHSVINYLGKKSGKEKDKEAYLQKRGLLGEWNGIKVLSEAAGLMLLEKRGQKNISGDHELFWLEVIKSKTRSEDDILMFQDLVSNGTIL